MLLVLRCFYFLFGTHDRKATEEPKTEEDEVVKEKKRNEPPLKERELRERNLHLLRIKITECRFPAFLGSCSFLSSYNLYTVFINGS